MRTLFHYYAQITPLEIQAKSEISTKPWTQWVLWGRFSIITHKSPPWKTGATQIEWITSKKIRNLHEIIEAMGFRRSIFHYYTQITHLENGGHTVWMDYKQKIPEFARNHWGNWFYEVFFSIITHKSPPWKIGITQFEWIISKKFRNFHETTEAMGFMRSLFPLLRTNHPVHKNEVKFL